MRHPGRPCLPHTSSLEDGRELARPALKTASIHTLPPNEQTHICISSQQHVQSSQQWCQVSECGSPTHSAERVCEVTWVKSSMYSTTSLHPTRAPAAGPGPHSARTAQVSRPTHVHAAALDSTRQLRACGSTQCNTTQLSQPAWCRSHARGVCEERQRASGRKPFLQAQVLLLLMMLPHPSKAQHVWVAGADIRDG